MIKATRSRKRWGEPLVQDSDLTLVKGEEEGGGGGRRGCPVSGVTGGALPPGVVTGRQEPGEDGWCEEGSPV